MSATRSAEVLRLFKMGDVQASFDYVQKALAQKPNDPDLLYAFGCILFYTGDLPYAQCVLARSVSEDPSNIEAQCLLAFAHKQLGTHKDIATARDLLLNIISQCSVDVSVIKEAAECCCLVGPAEKAVELWRKAVATNGASAKDFFHSSEILIATDHLSEGLENLRTAIKLNPESYDKLREDLEVLESANRRNSRSARLKKGRYPSTDLIQSDFHKAIIEYAAADLKDIPKFISHNSKFLAMGSCFARNIARTLVKDGYSASHMEIAEHINSTYANRCFVDWLEGTLPDSGLSQRIQEWLPEGFSKEGLLERIMACDVFIFTLGVAPSFFDRVTGEFVMPRPTALNSRALAEKYLFRTTTVAENVQNVLHLLFYVRKLNPGVKIILTVSPVPLLMTFEFKSAVAADCLSKSTLRVVAHEVVHNSGLREIYYWPSFEIFRWLGCHVGPVYGNDDGAAWHVSEDLVNLTVKCFIEMFSS